MVVGACVGLRWAAVANKRRWRTRWKREAGWGLILERVAKVRWTKLAVNPEILG